MNKLKKGTRTKRKQIEENEKKIIKRYIRRINTRFVVFFFLFFKNARICSMRTYAVEFGCEYHFIAFSLL